VNAFPRGKPHIVAPLLLHSLKQCLFILEQVENEGVMELDFVLRPAPTGGAQLHLDLLTQPIAVWNIAIDLEHQRPFFSSRIDQVSEYRTTQILIPPIQDGSFGRVG